MSERVNFTFRYCPQQSSQYATLLRYIDDEKEVTKKELILTSLSSLWMPYAYKASSEMSEKELQQLARFAIYKLKMHIHCLEDTFGLDTSMYIYAAPQSHQQSQQTIQTQQENLPSIIRDAHENNHVEVEHFQDLPELDWKDVDDIINNFC